MERFGPHLISLSHWGLFPLGYYICVANDRMGSGRAVYVRTDEDGEPIDEIHWQVDIRV